MTTYVVLGNFTDQGSANQGLTEAGRGFQEDGRDFWNDSKGAVLDAGTI